MGLIVAVAMTPVAQDGSAQFAPQEVEPQHRLVKLRLLHSGPGLCGCPVGKGRRGEFV